MPSETEKRISDLRECMDSGNVPVISKETVGILLAEHDRLKGELQVLRDWQEDRAVIDGRSPTGTLQELIQGWFDWQMEVERHFGAEDRAELVKLKESKQ